MSAQAHRFAIDAEFSSEVRAVVEDLRAILWQGDVRTRKLTWINRHVEEVLGYPLERWLNESGFWVSLIHPDDRESVLATCRQVLANGEDHQFDYRAIASDGRIVWLRHIVRVVKDPAGEVYALRGVMIDITERRAAEQSQRESEERFGRIFEEGPIAMVLIGLDRRVKKANQAFCKMLGFEEDELKRMALAEFIHPDDVAECYGLARQLLAGAIPNYRIEKRMIKWNGEIVWVDLFRTAVRDQAGTPLYGLGMAVDITERKRAEQALRDLSTQLIHAGDDARRRFARELHDSGGQNLAALKLNLSRLSRAPLAPELESLVADSLALAERTLDEIRTISHLLHPPLLDELGLDVAVRQFTNGFGQRSGIPVHLQLAEGLGRLAPRLETALFRIIQEGLTNTHRHSGATQCWVSLGLAGDRVSLELRDDGVGLPDSFRGHPENGSGAGGVGLSGMRERVRDLGGQLEIASSDPGCVIRATLPALRP